MTNKLALIIAVIIFALLAYDRAAHDWAVSIFLLRKLSELIEWMAFWR